MVAGRCDPLTAIRRIDHGNGGGLGKFPRRVIGVHSADGFNAFQRVAAVSATNHGNCASAIGSGHVEIQVVVFLALGAPLPYRRRLELANE